MYVLTLDARFRSADLGHLLCFIFLHAAKAMGFEMSPPAYLSLTPPSSRLVIRGLGGVNYASGGAGILDSTVSA